MVMVKMKGCIFMEITEHVAAYIGQGCAPLKAIKNIYFPWFKSSDQYWYSRDKINLNCDHLMSCTYAALSAWSELNLNTASEVR